MITPQERKELARKFLDKLKTDEKAALPTYEELKKASEKPEGHFCDICVDEYKEYNNAKRSKDRKWVDIYPECSGSKEYPPVTLDQWSEIHNFSTQEEAEDSYFNLRVTIDPVLWAAAELNVIMEGTRMDPNTGKILNFDRWYQIPMVQCLKEGTPVYMADGTIKPIEDIQIGEKVLSYNIVKREIHHLKSYVDWAGYTGMKECFRVAYDNGDYVDVTDNHPLLAHYKGGKLNQLHECKSYLTGYQSIQEGFGVGSKGYTINTVPFFGNSHDGDLAIILGYLVTDGYINVSTTKGSKRYVVELKMITEVHVTEFYNAVKRRFPNDKITFKHQKAYQNKYANHRQDTFGVYVRGKDSELIQFLQSIGVTNKTNRELGILDYAFKMSYTDLSLFVNRAWAGDGCLNANYTTTPRARLSLASGNILFLEKFRLLLRKVGVHSSKIYKGKGKGVSLFVGQATSIKCLLNFMGPVIGKEPKFYECKSIVDNVLQNSNYRTGGIFKYSSRRHVVSIESIGVHPVYDITVRGNHNFIANGIIVHNCSSRFKMFRCGRRCHVSSSVLHTNQGPMTFEQLYVNKRIALDQLKVRTYDVKTGELFYEHEFSVENNGVVPCYRITSSSGRMEEVSENHPFLVNAERGIFIPAKDLREGDILYADSVDGVVVEHVTSSEYIGELDTTAVTVYGTHTIVNNFISENTGKSFTMVLESLHYLATNSKVRVLLITPYEKQLAEFFDTMLELLDNSTSLRNAYKYNKTVHQLEFLGNGSVIKSISTGGDKAGGGDKVRGQKANLMVYDECIVKGNKVLTSKGYKNVEDVTTEDKAMYKGKPYEVLAAAKTTDKECYRIETELGQVLECSWNHPISTTVGDVMAKDLTPEHQVFVDVTEPNLIGKEYSMARLFAAWIPNGCLYEENGETRVFFYMANRKDIECLVEDIKSVDNLAGEVMIHEYDQQLPHIEAPGYCVDIGSYIANKLLSMGALMGSTFDAINYKIPKSISSASYDIQKEFVAAFLGCTALPIETHKKRITSWFEYFCKDNSYRNIGVMLYVKKFLKGQGINFSIRYKTSTGLVVKRGTACYIPNLFFNLITFLSNIGFRYNHRLLEDIQSTNVIQKKLNRLSNVTHFIRTLNKAKDLGIGPDINKYKIAKILGISTLNATAVLNHLKNPNRLIDKDYKRASITEQVCYVKSVQPIGVHETYNITVKDVHRFVAEGIETHNCDYIAQGDIEASIAILLDNPDCRILLSTTPTGKRGFFYKRATEKELRYKEFHHYSHASPSVTKAAHDEILSASSTSAFIREVLAEFGAETVGVFSPGDIDKAVKDYSLSESRKKGPVGGSKYIIGVDWNGRQIGVHMVVLEFNPNTGKFRVADVVRVRNKQFTQDRAVTTIIELFKFWGASWIYVDAGDGGAQTEQILKYAQQTGDERLAKALVPVWMQSNTLIRNPINGEEEKRPTKHYAITLLANRLERGLLILPKEEIYQHNGETTSDSDWGVVTQMMHYSIEKVRDNGLPKYADTPDHTLVGLYLAILGFQLKMTDLGGTAYDKYVGIRKDTILGGGITIEEDKTKPKPQSLSEYIPRSMDRTVQSTRSSSGLVGFSNEVLVTNPNGTVRLTSDVVKSNRARQTHRKPISRTF